ncbi:MAG: hypothetical protein LC637_02365 [Xanthomonadaceae bacterium]|nr:hypothetical protein [Xanthomonadaceae bacterium]
MIYRLTCSLIVALLCSPGSASGDGEDHELIGNMGAMQYFSHKLDLSIHHRNRELADFYAHEIEETLEETIEIDEYHGKPIGKLAEAMLVPAFERFEQALDDEGEWEAVERRFGELIDACNVCHQATGYDFINIQRSDENPYMQRFEPN